MEVFNRTAALLLTLMLISLTAYSQMGLSKDHIESEVQDVQSNQELITDGKAEMYFTENKGQWNEEINYLARTSFGFIYFYTDKVVYEIPDDETGYSISLSFEECRGGKPIGLERTGSSSNYFIGNDSEDWITEASDFGEIVYVDLWPGIDLLYRFQGGSLKYDIIAGENSDIEDIRISVKGHEDIIIEEDHLEIRVDERLSVFDSGLVAYYTNGCNVPIRFEIKDDKTFGFRAEKEPDMVLVIDPVVYSTIISGSKNIFADDMYVDDENCTYLFGSTNCPEFPNTTGAYQREMNYWDLFVMKLNSSGTGLVFSTFIGGYYVEYGKAITVDDYGNIYITGNTHSNDYPITDGVYQTNYNYMDIYITKLAANGSYICASTFLGGTGQEWMYDIEVLDREIYLIGASHSYDFPFMGGLMGGVHGWAMMVVFNWNLSDMVHGAVWDGYYGEYFNAMDINSKGEVIIGGWTSSTDFPVTANSYQYPVRQGRTAALIIRYDVNTASTVFASFIGEGYINDICLDSKDDIYFTGNNYRFEYEVEPTYPTTSGAYDKKHNGRRDATVGMIYKDGSDLGFSTFLGGSKNDTGECIEVDPSGRIYVTGITESPDFPITSQGWDQILNGAEDLFISRFNNNGSKLLYSTFLGGNEGETIKSTQLNPKYDLTLYGITSSDDFPTTNGSYSPTNFTWGGMYLLTFSINSKPSQPLELKAIGGDGFISLEWKLPLDNGGTKILNYTIYRGISEKEISFYNLSNSSRVFVDDDVEYGIVYYYRVTAWNNIGESPLSNVAANRSTTIPDPPKILSCRPYATFVQLVFEPPSFTGGLPITDYGIYRDGISLCKIPSDDPTYIDYDLDLNCLYNYSITSWNLNGESERSKVVTVLSKDIPSAPRNLSSYLADGVVHLSWEEGTSNGGIPLTNYLLYRTLLKYDLTTKVVLPPDQTIYSDEDVLTGHRYSYRLSAVNILGESSLSDSTSVELYSLPLPPDEINASKGNCSVILNWTSPIDVGGSEILRYNIYQGFSGNDKILVGSVNGKINEFEHNGLQRGEIYYYHLTSINAMGESQPSDTMSIMVYGIPSGPDELHARPLIKGVSVRWGSVPDQTATMVEIFSIYRKEGNGEFTRLYDVSRDCYDYVDGNVRKGIRYYYAVASVNRYGRSPLSIMDSAIPYFNPDKPEKIGGKSTPSYVEINWEPPLYDGGLEVRWYRIFRIDEEGVHTNIKTVVANISHHIDMDMDLGKSYTYYVTAVNDAGSSPASEKLTLDLVGLPSRPNNFKVQHMAEKVIITWETPIEDGGARILYYNLFRIGEDHQIEILGRLNGDILMFIDENVTSGSTYQYYLTGENIAGEGEPTEKKTIKIPNIEDEKDKLDITLITALVSFVLFVVLIIFLLGIYQRSYRRNMDIDWTEE